MKEISWISKTIFLVLLQGTISVKDHWLDDVITSPPEDKTNENFISYTCGVIDSEDDNDGYGFFTLVGGKWDKKEISYTVLNSPPELDLDYLYTIFQQAFDEWGKHVDLTFYPVENDNADITIRFGEISELNVLALSSYPALGSTVVFNNRANWSISNTKINLFYIAVHEFGHSLGLGHSLELEAVMYKRFMKYDPNKPILHPDDISGIQKKYNDSDPQLIPVSICYSVSIDAAFRYNKKIFFFKDENYYELKDLSYTPDNPRSISATWPEIKGKVDTGFHDGSGKIYFFKGTLFWVYENDILMEGYPKNISEGFPGIPNYLDNAVYRRKFDNYILFFKSSYIWSFNLVRKSVDGTTFLDKQLGLPHRVEASIDLSSDNTLFFCGSRYFEYSYKHNGVLSVGSIKELLKC